MQGPSPKSLRHSTMTGSRPNPEAAVQPVERPILCSPYAEPAAHWLYDRATGAATRAPGRRSASYWYVARRTGAEQLTLLAEEERDDLPLVNALRDDIRRWRQAEWDGTTPVTRALLRHWSRADRARRLFFCQLEAVETLIYLREILWQGKVAKGRVKLGRDDFDRLLRGERPSFAAAETGIATWPRLVDQPHEEGLPPLVRLGCKMATGSGKTVVMAMTIAWAFCNRARMPGNDRFPAAALVVCPNLTIKERLQVLRPETPDNYYEAFDIVPSQLLAELRQGKVLVTNWHQFAPESPHAESGKTYAVVDKGEESAEAFARRVLGDLYERAPLMVLNDEAHHAYRPAPVPEDEDLSAVEREEREEATVWVSGLDRLNQACGIAFCADLSATPFYLHGSGYIEGAPFPWLVSDFGLVDAIESGIVKIPRLPVSDTTGRPEPKFFALWRWITQQVKSGERLPGKARKPKPEVVWREAQDALLTLAAQWKERFDYLQQASPGKERTPPVLIIVCDNTDIAELFYRKISGEQTVEDDADDEDEDEGRSRRRKKKARVVYGRGELFPGYFSNREGFRPTLRIDSKLLAEAETEGGTRSDAAELLRGIVSTVGKVGQPGEQVRCVVSVQMLSEGWDANNVTHILGLRAFGSQLLCEQVVGRGLRRMDYTPDPATGLLTEEYVDIYGVPFSVIPFKGRRSADSAPDDKPKSHVRSLPERAALEIRFPVVEGFAFALRRNLVTADVTAMEPLAVNPAVTPTAVYVRPQVGIRVGTPASGGGFQAEEQDREEYYRSTHLQTIEFEIAREVTRRLVEGGGQGKLGDQRMGRHQLFPRVLRLVQAYTGTKVDFRGCDPRELGLERYMQIVVERLMAAIRPDDEAGEPPLLPVLNRYKPLGSSSEVDFKTTRPCYLTQKSQVNQVVLDTAMWEQSAAFRLEASAAVAAYVRNDHLECAVPYEFLGVPHSHFPDFLVRLSDASTLLLEIKGEEDEQDRAKHEAARRWVAAVNHWGRLGRWRFHVCHDPQLLGRELEGMVAGAAAGAA